MYMTNNPQFHNLPTTFVGQWDSSHTITIMNARLSLTSYSLSTALLLCLVLQNVGRWSRMLQTTLHDGPYWGLDARQMERMRRMEGERQRRCERGLHEQSIKINQRPFLMLGPKVLESLFQILHFGS